ncbi:MAG: hypothetical protein JST38_21565 [Bacteroidetes bacterium]|nr:hypothetical protein [Bacteroidota bacterium]MBS1943460.1 hypothetical protein [Bacteroidota bacterium]
MKNQLKGLVCACAMAASAVGLHAESLLLDGKLVVKGFPMDGAVLVVASKDGQQQVISAGLGHFTMQLDLQRSYLLSFEHPGCTTKQLMFNTEVPAASVGNRGFFFPFQVTLEPVSKSGGMEYAGPVGYIQYDLGVHGFAYSTDYRIAKDEELERRVDEVRQAWMKRTLPVAADPAARQGTLGEAKTAQAPQPAGASSGIGMGDVVAATVPRVAPMVHVLSAPAVDKPAPKAAEVPPVVRPAPRMDPLPESTLAPDATMPAVLPAPIGLPENVVRREVWADHLHVFTTVSVRDGNRIDEFRRVASYYGQVTYFLNGHPCTEHIYRQGTGLGSIPN